MQQKYPALFFLTVSVLLYPSCTKSCDKSQEKPSVTIKEPADRATIDSPIKVVLDVAGKKLKPASGDVNDKTSGHFILLIDDSQGFIEKGQPVTVGKNYINLDQGETNVVLSLKPGEHTITAQFSDGGNLSYGKDMAQTIKITIDDELDELPPSN